MGKKISDNEQSIIIKNIMQAKDKSKQCQIEADLHCISKGMVKEIQKKHGISLRILNGSNFSKKKRIEEELEESQEIITPIDEIEENCEAEQWSELAIPPVEDNSAKIKELSSEIKQELENKAEKDEKQKVKYKKPEIIKTLPKSSTSEDNAADDLITVEQALAALYMRVGTLKRQKQEIDDLLSKLNVQLNRLEDAITGRGEEL